MPTARVDDILARLNVDPVLAEAVDLRALIEFVLELGATDDEVLAAAPGGHLGSLGLDLTLRPAGTTLPLDRFAAESGIDPERVRRVWRAFGLSDAGDVAAPVTPDAAEAVRIMNVLIEALDEDAVLGFARVMAASMAQLADALTNLNRVGVEVPQLDSGTPYSEVAREYCAAARDLLPMLWDAAAAVFRRHLVLGSYQQWAIDESGAAVTQDRTIGFVDLVGSTEVLRSLSVAELATRVDQFEQLVWDRVMAAGGRVVKLIGDEAMFVVQGPAAACRLALALVDASPHPVRVGMAHGAVVALHGDYYGPTVNLAARLVAVAPSSEVLVSDAMRQSVSLDDVTFQPFTTGPLRGFPDVTTGFRLGRLGRATHV